MNTGKMASLHHGTTRLRRGILAVTGVLAAAALVACGPQGGTDVGNGRSVKLQLQGYEAPPRAGTQSITTASGVTIEGAWVAVDRIRFVPAANCDEPQTEIDVEGPFVADLAGPGVLGGPIDFAVASDTFCELRVGFHTLEAGTEPVGAPPALSGASIWVMGKRADGEAFTVTSRLSERLELEAKDAGGFSLAAGDNPLFVAYELASWVDALGLDTLATPIVVDDDQNADRLQPFEDAVKTSIRLLRDDDEDGVLDQTEAETGDELAD